MTVRSTVRAMNAKHAIRNHFQSLTISIPTGCLRARSAPNAESLAPEPSGSQGQSLAPLHCQLSRPLSRNH